MKGKTLHLLWEKNGIRISRGEPNSSDISNRGVEQKEEASHAEGKVNRFAVTLGKKTRNNLALHFRIRKRKSGAPQREGLGPKADKG